MQEELFGALMAIGSPTAFSVWHYLAAEKLQPVLGFCFHRYGIFVYNQFDASAARKRSFMNDFTGKPAVEFELMDVNGVVHTLNTNSDKWLLLVFHRHLG